MDGKTYTNSSDSYSYCDAGSQEPDRKVVYPDSNNKFIYSLVGNPDSVLYYQRNSISSENSYLTIFFIKKYSKKHKDDGILYFPKLKDLIKQFAPGKYPYAEDFGWENSQEGIALNIFVNDKAYISYNPFDPGKSSTLKSGFQKNSTFEIINFTKATSGVYNLEARFSAVITDAHNEIKELKNGYLRINFSPITAVDDTGE